MANAIKVTRRRVVTLVSLLLALALVLVVWLVIVPATRKQPSPPPPWSAPVQLDMPVDMTTIWADSGVPGIAIAQGDDRIFFTTTLAAVDTNTMKTIWSQQVRRESVMGYSFSIAGGRVLATAVDGQLEVVDILTGKVTQTTDLEDPDRFPAVQYVNSTIVITTDRNHEMCGRHWDNLSVCAWTSSAAFNGKPEWGSIDADTLSPAPFSFSGGKWLNTSSGVIDALTGAPAPFGADAYGTGTYPQFHSVFYAGPDDTHLFRCTYDTDGNHPAASCQRWNVSDDSAIGSTISGRGFAENAEWDLPYLIMADVLPKSAGYQQSAYSWQTGELVWTQSLDGSAAVPVGDAIFVGEQATQDYGSLWQEDSSYLVAADTGDIRWSGNVAGVLGVSQGIAYFYTFGDVSGEGQVVAYDLASSAKTPLWVLDGPASDATLIMSGSTILALSSSQRQLWSLSV